MADNYLDAKTGIPVVMPIVTAPVAFTPVLTNGPTLDLGSTGMYWYRIGNLMHIGGRILSSGAGAAGPLAMDVPMGLTVGPMVGLSGTNFNKGKFTRTGSAAANIVKQGTFTAAGGFKFLAFCYDDYTTASGANGAQNGSVVFPGSGWGVHINSEIVIPILEWGENTHQAYGAGMATAVTPGLVLKNKYQIKGYSGSTSSAGVVITFNNLVIGKVYRSHIQAFTNSAVITQVGIVHNGSSIATVRLPAIANSTGDADIVFIASATVVTMELQIGDLNGNGTLSRTWMSVEELNNYQSTTDFT